ncbi:Magnesium chelatase, subunit ChII [gamma proteobacterium HdN1]|nr:Magnesium chelatase, subunit ChII [gamma proteobacterium HdN1]
MSENGRYEIFPFSAIAGQEELKLALLLAAIEPQVGGVLVEGPRGTAKTTAARALASLMAPAPFVSLPLGCSLEHLVGSLDLAEALGRQTLRLAPGLLAKAHEGVLYVDEINLLPDALVDVLLDAAASGTHRIERDGLSHQHPARFVLIGTMNPQEGRLRPQLLDRLGLSVEVSNLSDPTQRSQVVRARLAFDRNPQAFHAAWEPSQKALAQRLAYARRLVAAIQDEQIPEIVWETIARYCVENAVDGLRADIVMLRAAKAFAAWRTASACGSEESAKESAESAVVGPEDVNAVSEFVLRHRRQSPTALQPLTNQPPSENQRKPAKQSPPSPRPAREPASQVSATPPQAPPGDRIPENEPSTEARTATENTSANYSTNNDWGEMVPQPVAAAARSNPQLQNWLTTLSHAFAEEAPTKKAPPPK